MTIRWVLNVLLLFVLTGQVVRFSQISGSAPCKLGWKEWNKMCYNLSYEMKDAPDATIACKKEGGDLVSIQSPHENDFIRLLAASKDVFIGLNDVDTEGTFVWSDGRSVSYLNWEDAQPDNDSGMEDCVIMSGADGKWNDTPCGMWYHYVCKISSVAEQTPVTDSKEQSFVTYEKKALIHHVIHHQMTSSALHCALLCLNNPSCKALNYKSNAGQESGFCELNDATADNFPLHLVWSSHSTYFVPIGPESHS